MRYAFALLILLFALPAASVESEASAQLRADFSGLVADINAGDLPAIKRGVTADSQALIDEIHRENLLQCVKGQASVNSTEILGDGRSAELRAALQTLGMKQNVKLKYALEQGSWKLDLVETLNGDPYAQVGRAKARIATLRQMMPQLSPCQVLPIVIAEAAMGKNQP